MADLIVFIRLTPVRDIQTNEIVGFEQPQRRSISISANSKLPVWTRSVHGTRIELGELGLVEEGYKKINGCWFMVAELKLRVELSEPLLSHLRFDGDGPFRGALLGFLVGAKGIPSGHKWESIELVNWLSLDRKENQPWIPILFNVSRLEFDPYRDLFYDHLSNGSYDIDVFYEGKVIGKADGYGWTKLGSLVFKKFLLHSGDISILPKDYFLHGCLLAKSIIGVGSAGMGIFPRNIYLGSWGDV